MTSRFGTTNHSCSYSATKRDPNFHSSLYCIQKYANNLIYTYKTKILTTNILIQPDSANSLFLVQTHSLQIMRLSTALASHLTHNVLSPSYL